MRRDEGFILPLAIILSLLFAAVVIHQIALLEGDRQFFQERKNYFQHELLLQSASTKLLSQLEKLDTIDEKGQFHFEPGTVFYQVTGQNELTVTVALTSNTTLTGERRATVIYSVDTHSIIKWTER